MEICLKSGMSDPRVLILELELQPRVLKEITDVLAEPLSFTFEKSLWSGEVTLEWKRANVVPNL